MLDIKEFIQFLRVSPPSGLAVLKREGETENIIKALEARNQPFFSFTIDETSQASHFFEKVAEALAENKWIVLDIRTPNVPGWFFEQLRNLDAAGHFYNKDRDKDIPLGAIRVLAMISEKNLAMSPFETLQACFGIILRE